MPPFRAELEEPVLGAHVVEGLDAAEDLPDVPDEDAPDLPVEPQYTIDLNLSSERRHPEVLGPGPHVRGEIGRAHV